MKDRGGSLTDDDRMNMQSEKNLIVSEQQEQKAQMDRFLQHQDLVNKNPDKFDPIKFAQARDEYMQTGRYDQTIPAWKPIDFGAYANDIAQKQQFVHDEGSIKDKYGMVSQESWNMPKGSEGKFLVGLLGKNPQADADFFERWDKADKESWFKQADANKDNKFSPEEQKNAIALWAMNEFGGVRMSKQTTPKGVAGASTAGMSNLSAFGKKTSYAPTEAKPTRLGQTDYPSYHTYNNLPVWDIPVGTPIKLLNSKGEKIIKPDNTISVDVTGYDEVKDEFTFIVKSNFEGLFGAVSSMERGKDWRIAIKRTDLPPEYNTLEIKKDGKTVKVGDIKRGTSATPANGQLDEL